MKTPSQRLVALREAVDARQRLKWLFFWGHSAPPGGVTKACLSQWYPSPFSVAGERYETAEHWMMAEKARLFGDQDARSRILAAPHPGEAKKLGREVRGFDESQWAEARYDIVVKGNLAKFDSDAALRQFLITTGDRVLAEASPLDRIWGTGLTADDPRARDPSLWRGLNLLGFALMEVRERLRASTGL